MNIYDPNTQFGNSNMSSSLPDTGKNIDTAKNDNEIVRIDKLRTLTKKLIAGNLIVILNGEKLHFATEDDIKNNPHNVIILERTARDKNQKGVSNYTAIFSGNHSKKAELEILKGKIIAHPADKSTISIGTLEEGDADVHEDAFAENIESLLDIVAETSANLANMARLHKESTTRSMAEEKDNIALTSDHPRHTDRSKELKMKNEKNLAEKIDHEEELDLKEEKIKLTKKLFVADAENIHIDLSEFQDAKQKELREKNRDNLKAEEWE